MARIELVNVSHSYMRGEYAVRDINLFWEDGVSSALLGPSGCGKTTLLKIISGLLQPTEGEVLLNGRRVNELKPKERNIAQVFQFPVVYETLNIFNNLAFPLRNRGYPESIVKERVHTIAELLELTDQLHVNANSLSAAEKQLISLGRGVIREDLAAILLDEPLTVIDPHQKWQLRRKLKQLQQRFEITMIYVTHDQHEALTFADYVTVMDTGIALQTGSPHDLHSRPEAPFVGYFIGSPGMNIFPARLADNQIQVGRFSRDLASETVKRVSGENLKIGIRPEFVVVSSAQLDDSFECTVQAVHLTGTSKLLDLLGADLEFKTRVDDTSAIKAGDTVWAQFPIDKTMIYINDRLLASLNQEIAS